MMRPEGTNDLQIMWAIRDIPSSISNYIEKLLLFTLLSLIGNKANCWPSIPELIEKTCLSKSSVLRGLESLEKKKFIQIDHKIGRGHANEYSLNYIMLMQYAPEKVSERNVLGLNGVSQKPIKPEKVSHRQIKGVSQTPQERHEEKQEKQREAAPQEDPLSFDNFKPKQEHFDLAKSRGVEVDLVLAKYLAYCEEHGKNLSYYNLKMWILNEKPTITLEKDENRPRVPEWAPGHPDYDRMVLEKQRFAAENRMRQAVEMVKLGATPNGKAN